MITRFFCLLGLLCALTLAIAQPADPELPQVVPPSPEAASLGKYGDNPVSTYTGTPSISVPIYTLANRSISVPISISYHAGGIKVEEEASRVGLGWSLNAGGVITRTIRGIDDFKAVDGWLHNSVPTLPSAPNLPDYSQPGCEFSTPDGTVSFYDHIVNNNELDDLEPDLFFFNFLGYSGKFVFRKDGKILLANKDAIKIQTNSGNDWTVTTPDGTVFDFDKKEEVRNYIDPNQNPDLVATSTWFLTKITSPLGDEIHFDYLEQTGVVSKGAYSAKWEDPAFFNCSNPGQTIGGTYQENFSDKRVHDTWILDKIHCEKGYVQFLYNNEITNPREDVLSERRLTGIQAFTTNGGVNTLVRDFEFDNDHYFAQGTAGSGSLSSIYGNDQAWKRLKINKLIQKIGQDTEYVFSYSEDIDPSSPKLPYKTTFAQDFWGFYNGVDGNTEFIPEFIGTSPTSGDPISVGGNRYPDASPDDEYILAGMLRSIRYPTGGTTVFEFEQNDFSNGNFSLSSPVQFTESNHSNASVPTEFHINAGDVINGHLVFAPEFIWDPNVGQTPAPESLYVKLTPPPGNGPPITIDYYNDCINPNSPNCVMENISAITGTWTIEAFNNYPSQIGTIKSIGYVTWSQFNDPQNPSNFQKGGGLRIKRIKNYTEEGISSVKRFDYHYEANGEVNSHGLLMKSPDFDQQYFQPNVHSSVCAGTSVSYGCERLVISSSSVGPLSTSAQGNPVGYSTVTQYEGENGENGKTVFAFNNFTDQVIAYEAAEPAGMPNVPNNRNGLMAKEEVYRLQSIGYPSNSFTLLRETNNTYVSTSLETEFGIKITPFYSPANPYHCNVWVFAYPIQSERIDLISTTNTVFDQNGNNPITTTNTFEYNDTDYQLSSTSTLNSDGISYIHEMEYPLDYLGNCGLLSTCEDDYELDLATCWSDRDSCIANAEVQHQSLLNIACENLADCQQEKELAIQEDCYITVAGVTTLSIPCLVQKDNEFPCSSNYSFDIALYNNRISLHNCESNFNTCKAQAISDKQTCISSYESCMDNEISINPDPELSAIYRMQRDHIWSPMIEKKQYQLDNGTESLIAAVKTDFQTVNTDVVVPDVVYKTESLSPILKPNFLANPANYYQPQWEYDHYDQSSHVLQHRVEEGRPVSYIWQQDLSLVLAQVMNAPYDQIAYTSFEKAGVDSPLETDVEDGGWHIKRSAAAGWSIANRKTGLRGFHTQPGGNRYIEKTNIPGGEYIISFWHKGGPIEISVSGGGGTYDSHTGTDPSEMVYYELKVAISNNATITIKAKTGAWNSYIDELRLYPADAQMTTYCYDEALRVHTVTNANNQSSYYEYDDFGRLKYVRDQDGNYVQGNKYNYGN